MAVHESPKSTDEKSLPSEPTTIAEDEPLQYPHGYLLALSFSALLISMFLVILDLTIVSTAIPRITRQFHSLNQVGWYGSAFFLTMAVFQSLWGKIYKYFPLKISYLTAIFVFEMGTLACAVSKGSATFIAGRAIAGVGGAGVLNGTYIIIAGLVPPEKAPFYIGLTGVMFTVASVAGPLLGGTFTNYVTWRWCFYVNLPIGGATMAILAASLHVPGAARPVKAPWREIALQMDLPGGVAVTAGLICYLLALQWAGITVPWNDSIIIGLLIGWICLTLAFVVIEYYQRERALIAPRLLKDKIIRTCCIYIFFLNAANYLRIYYIPIYFQALDGVSPEESGIRYLPLIVATSIFTLVAGASLGKFGYYQPFLLFGALLATLGSGLIYTLTINSPAAHYIGYQILVGIGDGLAAQVPVTAVQAFALPADIPTVTATVLFFQLLSGVLGVSAAESIFSNRLLAALARDAPTVDKDRVLNAGASGLRLSFDPEQLQGLLKAYEAGLRGAWIAAITLCGLAFCASFFVPLNSIKGSRSKEEGQEGKEGKKGREIG